MRIFRVLLPTIMLTLLAAVIMGQTGGGGGTGAGGGGSVTSVATTSPITGGTITTTGTIACATCATTTNGGALSATAPVTLSAAGVIACATCSTTTGTVTSVTFTGDGTVLSSTPSSAVTTSGTLTAALANAGAGTMLGNFTTSAAAPTYAAIFITNPQTATYQATATDFNLFKTITVASGTFTITLVASGSQPVNGQFINVVNYGSGVVTIARSGQNINGGTASLTLNAGSATAPTSAFILSDGVNYFATLDEGTVGTVTSIATTAPLGGGTITGSGTLTCTTCATTTNGGALSGTAPMAISAGGAISMAPSSAATITEGAAGDATTFAGVETANLTYPWVLQNTNSTNNNTSGVLIVNGAGTSTGQVPLVVNGVSTTGDLVEAQAGGSVASGVLTAGTVEFKVTAAGAGTFNGGLTVGGSVTVPSGGSLSNAANGTTLVVHSGLDGTVINGQNATLTVRGQNVTGGSTASTQGGPVTINGGDNAASGATETAAALTLRGGDTTNASTAVNVAGAVTIRGGNTASSSTSGTAGSVTIQPGSCAAAAVSAACNGTVKLLQAFFTTGTATVHSLACVTATNTVATCTSAANGTNAIGWIDSVSTNTVYVQMGAFGQVVTGVALSATFTAGQWACADTATTAGDMVASATKCAAGLPGGVVLTTATTTNPVFIVSQTL